MLTWSPASSGGGGGGGNSGGGGGGDGDGGDDGDDSVGCFLRREQRLFALYTDLKRNPERLKVLQKYRKHSRAAYLGCMRKKA